MTTVPAPRLAVQGLLREPRECRRLNQLRIYAVAVARLQRRGRGQFGKPAHQRAVPRAAAADNQAPRTGAMPGDGVREAARRQFEQRGLHRLRIGAVRQARAQPLVAQLDLLANSQVAALE